MAESRSANVRCSTQILAERFQAKESGSFLYFFNLKVDAGTGLVWRSEVRIIFTASSSCGLPNQSHTKSISLLVYSHFFQRKYMYGATAANTIMTTASG